jgi:7,8-dihydropterin-6-yl-methyl-4-(beta-D-ribofuranosyl)aminobenzene 5'-phosphate synthase
MRKGLFITQRIFHMRWIILLIALVAVIAFVAVYTLRISEKTGNEKAGNESIRLVVLVDNNPYKQGLKTAWSLSIYVETGKTRFLFDTGPDPAVLKANAEGLGIDLTKVDFVVISHVHGDHTNGLKLLASIKPGMRVYVPPDKSLISYVENLGLKPIQVNSTVEVSEGIYAVKPLYGPPVEEALAIKTGKGLVILVGCSHPGVVNIVRQAVKDIGMRPYIVLGGFHMAGATAQEVQEVASQLVEMGVEKIYPLHCSGDAIRSYLAEHYKESCGGVGLELIIRE